MKHKITPDLLRALAARKGAYLEGTDEEMATLCTSIHELFELIAARERQHVSVPRQTTMTLHDTLHAIKFNKVGFWPPLSYEPEPDNARQAVTTHLLTIGRKISRMWDDQDVHAAVEHAQQLCIYGAALFKAIDDHGARREPETREFASTNVVKRSLEIAHDVLNALKTGWNSGDYVWFDEDIRAAQKAILNHLQPTAPQTNAASNASFEERVAKLEQNLAHLEERLQQLEKTSRLSMPIGTATSPGPRVTITKGTDMLPKPPSGNGPVTVSTSTTNATVE
jgi:hypothetical protein